MRPLLAVLFLVLAVPAVAQTPPSELARDVLDGCLAERAEMDLEMQQACYYEAASAFDLSEEAPTIGEAEVGAALAVPVGSDAIEAELTACLDAQFETQGAADCYAAAAVQYRDAIVDLETELAGFMTEAEAEAFREAAYAWADYVQAELRYLDEATAPSRYADPSLAAMDREQRLLQAFRDRYAQLDLIPRG